MDTGRTIRLVAVFVVGVVLAMGGAMIYALATHLQEQPAASNQTVIETPVATIAPDVSKNTSTPVNPPAGSPEPNDSIVQVPTPAPEQPSPTVPSQPQQTRAAVPLPAPAQSAKTTVKIWTAPRVSAPETQSQAQTTTFAPFQTAPTAPLQNSDGRVATAPRTVTLWAGTQLTVRLTRPLSTESSAKGQYFRAILQSPIVKDGFIIADAGSPVEGEVIESKRAGMFGRANLRLTLLQLHTTDNQDVRIETESWDDRGRSRNPVTAPIRTAFGATVGAFDSVAHGSGLVQQQNADKLKNGRNVTLPPNSVLQFRLAAPVTLTEHTR